MEPELKRAMTRAGLKLGGGLALVAALVGIRVVTAEPASVAEGVAALERLEEELATETAEAGTVGRSRATATSPGVGRGVHTREAPVPRRQPTSRSQDADRLVSCSLGGTVQFMRAADCLSRGGDSTDFDPED